MPFSSSTQSHSTLTGSRQLEQTWTDRQEVVKWIDERVDRNESDDDRASHTHLLHLNTVHSLIVCGTPYCSYSPPRSYYFNLLLSKLFSLSRPIVYCCCCQARCRCRCLCEFCPKLIDSTIPFQCQ